MKRITALWVSALVALTVAAPSSASEPPPGPNPKRVIFSDAPERQAVTHDGYWAWIKSTPKAGWQLYLRSPKGKVRHVNRPGTEAMLGALAGRRLVYREYTRKRSTIRFMDLRTGRKWDAPPAINRRRTAESWPVMSSDWLVVTRFNPRRFEISVVAHNFRTKRTKVVFRSGAGYGEYLPYIQPGQMSGRYLPLVVWYRGSRSTLQIHDLKTGVSDVIYDFDDYLWAPSIREDGTVYAIASGDHCGARVRLVRYNADPVDPLYHSDGAVLLHKLGDGFDSFNTQTYVDAAGKQRVLFQRSSCSNRRSSDIWSYEDMVSATVMKEGSGFGTVSSDPAGIQECDTTCTALFPGGTWLSLTAQPGPGSHFVGWSKPCEGRAEDGCLFYLDKDRTVTATFDLGI